MSHSKAIVLSSEVFGEADLYVQFLSQRWGVITTLAKSARKSKKRYVGGLDIFCHDEIYIRGEARERPYLNELKVLNAFTGLRDSLERTLAAGKCVQWTRKLVPPSTPVPAIYSLLGQTLALLEKESDPARLELLNLIFRLKLIHQLGLKPRVDACVRCETLRIETMERKVYFDLEAGGILCEICAPHSLVHSDLHLEELDRNFLEVGDQIRLTAWGQIQFPAERVNHLTRLIGQFMGFHTHLRLPH